MKENFISRAKADGQVFIKMVNLVAKLSRLKLEIRSKTQEKEKILKSIGIRTLQLYEQNGAVDGKTVLNTVGTDLREVELLDRDIRQLESDMQQTRATFRGQPKEPPKPADPAPEDQAPR